MLMLRHKEVLSGKNKSIFMFVSLVSLPVSVSSMCCLQASSHCLSAVWQHVFDTTFLM